MKHRKMICAILAVMLVLLLEPSFIYAAESEVMEDYQISDDTNNIEDEKTDIVNNEITATGIEDECDHYWITDFYNDCCECVDCGMIKPHNYIETYRWPATCKGQLVDKECLDCGCSTSVTEPIYAPHEWSETLWWDMDGEDYYVYGKYCNSCDEFQKVVKTVKKGKTKRILPKSFLKGAKKKHVVYSKKKVKAMKDGRVKGKKRGSVSTVIWDIKYRNHRGYTWWETYEVVVKVK